MKKFWYFFYNVILVLVCMTNAIYAGNIDIGGITGPLTEITEVLLIIAGGVCVGKLIHIGILYVMSSAAEKSNAKMAMVPWIIGTIVCFGAATIGPAIIGIFQTNDNVLDY